MHFDNFFLSFTRQDCITGALHHFEERNKRQSNPSVWINLKTIYAFSHFFFHPKTSPVSMPAKLHQKEESSKIHVGCEVILEKWDKQWRSGCGRTFSVLHQFASFGLRHCLRCGHHHSPAPVLHKRKKERKKEGKKERKKEKSPQVGVSCKHDLVVNNKAVLGANQHSSHNQSFSTAQLNGLRRKWKKSVPVPCMQRAIHDALHKHRKQRKGKKRKERTTSQLNTSWIIRVSTLPAINSIIAAHLPTNNYRRTNDELQ